MFNNKTLNVVFSIVLAILLWVFVVVEINPQTSKKFTGVEVQYINANGLDAKDLAVYDAGTVTVDVELEGNSNVLNAMTAADISVTVDLFGREKGENSIPVSVQVPEGVRVASVSPENIQVLIEDKITISKELELNIIGSIPSNYKLSATIFNPTQVNISGPESLVSQVDRAVAEISSESITGEKITVSATVKAYNKEGKEIKGLTISHNTATATLEFTIEETETGEGTVYYYYSSDDISVNNLSENLEAIIEQAQIRVIVTADRSILETIRKEDIILSVNLEDLIEGNYTLDIKTTTALNLTEIVVEPLNIEVEIKTKGEVESE